MDRRLKHLLFGLLALVGAPLDPSHASAGGYLFNRVIIWSEPGQAPPRFYLDNEVRRFVLVLPDSAPDSEGQMVGATRYVLRSRTFLPAEPIQFSGKGPPPDPGWIKRRTEMPLDVNQDGKMERVRGWTVEIPSPEHPRVMASRVLVELWEGERIFFGDLLEGPGGSSVSLHSVSAFDFTGEGYPDFIVRLESGERSGIAFYSQAVLHLPGISRQVIPGFSERAFRADRYGMFDLNRSPEEFLEDLPETAKPEDLACVNRRGLEDAYARSVCHFHLEPPYLGWVESFDVDYEPSHRILAFELRFPTGEKTLEAREALDALRPLLGGGFRVAREGTGKEKYRVWTWEGAGATARLVVKEGSDDHPEEQAVSLTLARN